MSRTRLSQRLWQLVAAMLALTFAIPLIAQPAHGDHSPDHNGIVMMHSNEDMHFEVVIIDGGGIQLYLSSGSRAPLPAATVSDVVVEIERPGSITEFVSMMIAASGDHWMGNSTAVRKAETIVRIGFVLNGEPFFLDIPGAAFPPIRQTMESPIVIADDHNAH